MHLSKTTSLPKIIPKFNKYSNFFTNRSKSKDMALDELHHEEVQNNEKIILDGKTKIHSKNLKVIEQKSTMKSKVEAFLTDSRKMGILDHAVNDTKNRRSLAKIAYESIKPIITEAEQQKIYLTQIKEEYNDYHERNTKTEKSIKNTEGLTIQIKQKSVFYEGLLKRNSISQERLLDERRDNLVMIRFQAEKLQNMRQRLKEINQHMKKKVKDAQNSLKREDFNVKNWNDLENVKQEELNNKQFLKRHYSEFENKKSETMDYQTSKAMNNMQEDNAAQILKKHQSTIIIMDQEDYQREVIINNHIKNLKQFFVTKFYQSLLDSVWEKYSSKYQSYEKAQKLIKMYSLERNSTSFQLFQSYNNSFQIKGVLESSIDAKEKEVEALQLKNKELQERMRNTMFEENKELEETYKKQFTGDVIGEKQESNALFKRNIISRICQANRKQQLIIKLRTWIRKQTITLQLKMSKKKNLTANFLEVIDNVRSELGKIQSVYHPKQLLRQAEKQVKANKYGNIKKKK